MKNMSIILTEKDKIVK